MHKRLRSAQDLGLLEVVTLSGTGDLGRIMGNTYRLGPVARKERGRWVSLGNQFFSKDGLARALERTGALLYDALGRDGRWLSYSLAARGSGESVSVSEVFAAAKGMLRSEGLVSSHLERFVVLGLATHDVPAPDGALRYTVHGLPVLAEVAETQGWVARYRKLQQQVSNDQLGLTSLTAQILNMRCCYCGREGPSETIEHVPPQHWTGTRQAGLLLPACGDCNQPDGPKICTVPPLSVGRPDPRVLFSRDEWEVLMPFNDVEVLKAFEPAYVLLIREYRDAMKLDNPERALEAAKSLAPIAEGVRQGFLEIVDRETGEMRTVEVSQNFAVWLAQAVTETVPRAAILRAVERDLD